MQFELPYFVQFIQEKYAVLLPDESAVVNNLIQQLESEPAKDEDELMGRLSRFLIANKPIMKLLKQYQEEVTRAPSKVKINPQEFTSILRNAVLASESHPQSNEPAKPTS